MQKGAWRVRRRGEPRLACRRMDSRVEHVDVGFGALLRSNEESTERGEKKKGKKKTLLLMWECSGSDSYKQQDGKPCQCFERMVAAAALSRRKANSRIANVVFHQEILLLVVANEVLGA